MKTIIPLISLALYLLVLPACKSTKKAYEKGDYETAVLNSIDRLRKSPNNKKASETLRMAYPAVVDYFQELIANAKQSADPLRWESALRYYGKLNAIYDEIQRSPRAKRLVPTAQYFGSEYSQAERNAADARYALGDQALTRGRQGDRESAKEAFYHFEKAVDLRPGLRDADSKKAEALDLATLYVQIEPIPMHSRSLSLSNEFFENQMAEFIRARPTSPFIRFFAPDQVRNRPRDPDQVIQMVFDDFVVGQGYIKETVVQRKRENVVVGKLEVSKDSTVDVTGTVKAEVHQFQKEISSSGLLDFRIIDKRSGRLLTQRKFPGTFIWFDYWGFFNGDERALYDEDKKFVRKSRPDQEPLPQDLFIEFTKPIFDQVTGFVGEFYRNY